MGAVIKLHDLKPAPGSKRAGRRVARGIGGKGGKTAGRGTKGQKARGTVRAGFEGGQLPLVQRVPKLKGFKNPFRVEYRVINLDALDTLDLARIAGGPSDGAVPVVSPETLASLGLVRKGSLVKVLGRGEIHRAMHVKAHRFSGSAERAIVQAGGSIEVLALPFGHGRPPARGNALTNR